MIMFDFSTVLIEFTVDLAWMAVSYAIMYMVVRIIVFFLFPKFWFKK